MKPCSCTLWPALAAGVLATTSLRAAPGDGNWDNRFGITSPTYQDTYGAPLPGSINAIAVDGTNTYVGGYFTDIGGIAASNMARWDGRQWHALGSGVSDAVKAIVVNHGTLYAGGVFTNAGALAVNGIARWDGTNWSALGGGMNVSVGDSISGPSGVDALAFYDGSLYAGGNFTAADGQTANGFARWDGTAWHSYVTFESSGYTNIGVGDLAGNGGGVNSMTVMNGQLYVGGLFEFPVGNDSASTSISNLFVFDGNSFVGIGDSPSYQSPGFAGFFGGIYALATDGAHLFAGGNFTQAGTLSVSKVAEWDGSAWSALGLGMDGQVNALLYSGGQLYAGGGFANAGGSPASGFAQWNGAQWTNGISSIASYGSVNALAVDSQGAVLAGGYFSEFNGAPINGLARLANGQWRGLGLGLNLGGRPGDGEVVATDGTNAYIGGRFSSAGGVSGTNIIWWDGTIYHTIGSASSDVYALALWNGSLYAGGDFTSVNGVSANHIARWDGTNWFALGNGTGDSVYALLASGTNFYVGGQFASVGGGLTAHGIARWDGTAWQNVGPAQSLYYGTVYALASYRGNLVAGGHFSFYAPGINIAQWNGTSWSPLAGGLSDTSSGFESGSCHALTAFGTNLIAGGFFISAGGQAATNLAAWNGSAWSPLGNVGGGGGVMSLATLNGSLFAGGAFTNINGLAASGMAKWDGGIWSPLGSGLGLTSARPYASAMTSVGNDLFVVGEFGSAGGNPSAGIAVWHGSTTVTAPQIAALLSGNKMVLSWPLSASSYTLETSVTLGPGVSWKPVISGIVTNGNSLRFTNSPNGASGFFRLHQ